MIFLQETLYHFARPFTNPDFEMSAVAEGKTAAPRIPIPRRHTTRDEHNVLVPFKELWREAVGKSARKRRRQIVKDALRALDEANLSTDWDIQRVRRWLNNSIYDHNPRVEDSASEIASTSAESGGDDDDNDDGDGDHNDDSSSVNPPVIIQFVDPANPTVVPTASDSGDWDSQSHWDSQEDPDGSVWWM
jgi:hypothetical protein